MPIQSENISGTLYLNIRQKKSARLVRTTFALAFWLGITIFAGTHILTRMHQHLPIGVRTYLLAVAGPVAACLYLYSILWSLYGFTRVSVTETQLRTESVLFGLAYGQKNFKNETVKALRYEEWSGGRSGRQNGIRFSHYGALVTIARNAPKQDSLDLINQLCEVYKFNTPPPKSTTATN